MVLHSLELAGKNIRGYPPKPKTSVFVIGDEFSNAYSSNPYQNKFWLTN
jgi:hypothetical protein